MLVRPPFRVSRPVSAAPAALSLLALALVGLRPAPVLGQAAGSAPSQPAPSVSDPATALAAEPTSDPWAIRPAESVVDRAGLFGDAARTAAEDGLAKLREGAGPIRIVTVAGLKAEGADPAEGWTTEAWARGVLERWRAPGVAAPLSGELLVVVAVEERRVRAVGAGSWLAESARLRRVERVLSYWLERGEADAALAHGVATLERLVAGKSIPLPGGAYKVWVIVIGFVIGALALVNYLREGATSLSYRVGSAVFSGLGAALTFALAKGVDLGAGLAGGEDRAASERAVVGRW